MTFEVLSPEEIKCRYRQAADQKAMLRILAELTCSTEKEMAVFLGVAVRSTGKIDRERAYELYEAGMNDYQIANILGVNRSAVSAWRTERGLPCTQEAVSKARMAVYEMGLSDKEAAKTLGMTIAGWRSWKNRRGLKYNRKKETKQ